MVIVIIDSKNQFKYFHVNVSIKKITVNEIKKYYNLLFGLVLMILSIYKKKYDSLIDKMILLKKCMMLV